jgi:glycerophosphoryl diester phosphodiesterase
MMKLHKPQVWAHRGFSGRYPENTLAAFAAALDLGVDGIEFDVHLTRDDRVVVIHDERLERTTNGTGYVREHTLAELKELDAGSWFGKEFAGLTIPTLGEVLSVVSAHTQPVRLNIEFKSDLIQYPNLEAMAWQQVNHYDLQSSTIFSSFNHFSLRNLKQAYPSAQIGLLYMEGLVEPWRYAKFLNATALHPYFPAIDLQTVAEAQEQGIAVNVFTVNESSEFHRMLELGVDAVISDVPDKMMVRSGE